MDKLKPIQTDLQAARKDFRTLTDELPQFHTLLSENETEAEKLRKTRADLSKQAEAKGRVNVAREILEQHQSDIATAQAEVSRLEALERRKLLLLEMCSTAKDAATHRAGIDRAVETAQKALGQAVTMIYREWLAEREARQAFVATGRQLVRHFGDAGQRWDTALPQQIALDSLATELRDHGVDLDAATDSATGTYSAFDTERRALPRDELSMHIWEVFKLLTKGQPEAVVLTRYAPSRVNPNAPIPDYVAPELRGL